MEAAAAAVSWWASLNTEHHTPYQHHWQQYIAAGHSVIWLGVSLGGDLSWRKCCSSIPRYPGKTFGLLSHAHTPGSFCSIVLCFRSYYCRLEQSPKLNNWWLMWKYFLWAGCPSAYPADSIKVLNDDSFTDWGLYASIVVSNTVLVFVSAALASGFYGAYLLSFCDNNSVTAFESAWCHHEPVTMYCLQAECCCAVKRTEYKRLYCTYNVSQMCMCVFMFMFTLVAINQNVFFGRYVANKLLESGDRDQLMKLIGRVQGFIFIALLVVRWNGYGGKRWQLHAVITFTQQHSNVFE